MIRVPDSKWGEAVQAVIVLNDRQQASEAVITFATASPTSKASTGPCISALEIDCLAALPPKWSLRAASLVSSLKIVGWQG